MNQTADSANNPATAAGRRFLFLQGPHGPFFFQLGRLLADAGAGVHRVGFNAGDTAFWPDRASFTAHTGTLADWPAALERLLDRRRVSDLVLYGDSRPVHAAAIAAARGRGLTVHVFEEGYLRPYWATYERGGSNGNSRLATIPLARMRAALAACDPQLHEAPTHWGDTRQHIWYGALYHWHVLFRNRAFPGFAPHRALPVRREFALHLRRLALIPVLAARRGLTTARLLRRGAPYHLVLLQLEHDASFVHFSPFGSMTEFIDACIDGFARGAPAHHHLVFKAHPLEDGRAALEPAIRAAARARGIGARVHFVPGGKLAPLLDHARSAVTVNSTAGQQALWRGLPLKALGRAVYARPEFVSDQPLAEFFADPAPPDVRAYRDFRAFLLETSQLPGGYYSAKGRARLLRQVADLMLARADPYEALLSGTALPRQHLRVVR